MKSHLWNFKQNINKYPMDNYKDKLSIVLSMHEKNKTLQDMADRLGVTKPDAADMLSHALALKKREEFHESLKKVGNLQDAMNATCGAYQDLGEALKGLSLSFQNFPTPEELTAEIYEYLSRDTNNIESLSMYLHSKYIILNRGESLHNGEEEKSDG